MAFLVKKSFMRQNPEFEAMVVAHAREMTEWIEREKRVAQDVGNDEIPEIDRWVSCPCPVAPNEYVAAAVTSTGIIDYVPVDDDPTPEELLQPKKNSLIDALRAAEAVARHTVMPVTRRPLFGLRLHDLATAEAKKREEIVRSAEQKAVDDFTDYKKKVSDISAEHIGFVASAAAKIGVIDDPRQSKISEIEVPQPPRVDLDVAISQQRTNEETSLIETASRVAAADARISRAVAQAMNDIEDLTSSNVDDYVIPDFSALTAEVSK